MKQLFCFSLCCLLSTAASAGHYRGLSVVNDLVVWMSGSKGTVVRTLDGGVNWDTLNPPGYDKKDFRDIYAWDKKKAVVMSSGDSAVLLYTQNAGKTWSLIAADYKKDVFWDAIDVLGKQIIMVGDGTPVDLWFGKSFSKPVKFKAEYIDKTIFWDYIENTGNRLMSLYAASGTVVQWLNKNSFAFAPVVAQASGNDYLFVSAQIQKQKKAQDPALKSKFDYKIMHFAYLPFQNQEAGGAYSFRMDKQGQAVAVGGSYLRPNADDSTACYSSDSGKTWLPSQTMPLGYRSCVCQFGNTSVWFCTGTNGTDISTDFGVNWRNMLPEGYNACAASEHYLWLAGNHGSWKRVNL
jgi:hypothetical protein